MIYLRLAHGGIVELPDAATAELEGDMLVMRASDGHVVCSLDRNDALAYSARPDLLIPESDFPEPEATP